MRLAILAAAAVACGGPTTARVGGTATTASPSTPACGDGVVQGDEGCDDGNGFGGDGCDPACAPEDGLLEVEPDDTWDRATPWDGSLARGGLPEGDVDCWALDLPACASVTVRQVPACLPGLVLTLHDPTGAAVATGTQGPDGCAVIDPAVAVGAVKVPGGTHAVCVRSVLGQAIPAYAIEASVDPTGAGFPVPDDDRDGDGVYDRCDEDRDGDGVDNAVDNCPDAPNGPDMAPLAPSAGGFLRHWLALGPITGTASALDCRPSDDMATGDDPGAAPELGDTDAGLPWVAWFDGDDRLDFLDRFGAAAPPREVYVHTYVFSATARPATLAVGADDGVFAWFDGVQVLDVSSCQGTSIDAFTAPVTLPAGWSRLTLKVRDQGGGWGLYARFLDPAGAPITDLELSLTASGPWVDDQGDLDGDGLGDVCDDTP